MKSSIERQATGKDFDATVKTEMGSTLRILVADDNPDVLSALADLIRESGDVEIVSLVTNVEEAVEAAERHQPDIAFLDDWLRGGGAEAATPRIKAVSPRTLVVCLASAKDHVLASTLRASGAAGCYEKEKLSLELPLILGLAFRD